MMGRLNAALMWIGLMAPRRLKAMDEYKRLAEEERGRITACAWSQEYTGKDWAIDLTALLLGLFLSLLILRVSTSVWFVSFSLGTGLLCVGIARGFRRAYHEYECFMGNHDPAYDCYRMKFHRPEECSQTEAQIGEERVQ